VRGACTVFGALLLVVGACRRPPPTDDTGDDTGDTGSDTGDTGSDTSEPPPTLMAVNDRAYLPQALSMIGEAEHRVWAVEYLIYDSGSPGDVVDAMVAAAQRGVDVRVLADEEGYDTADALARLSAAGALTKLDAPTVTTHNKLILADDVTLVGSHNLTSSAMDANTEGSVRVAVPEVTAFYATYFEALWANPEGVGTLAPADTAPIVPLHDRGVTQALLGCIEDAEDRVDLVMYALSYRAEYPDSEVAELLTALSAAHERGVTVRVVLDHSSWIVENAINDAAAEVLLEAGVAVRHPPDWHVTHAKVLTCDHMVIVSDANWSYSGLTLYNGTSLQATDAALAEAYRVWFEDIWASGEG